MAVLKKGQATEPIVRKERIEGLDDSIGGDVVVRGLLLAERLAFKAQIAREGSADMAIMQRVPQLLAITVIDADGEPLWSAEQWNAFGSQHEDDALRLFNAAMRLSDFDAEDNAKNSQASPT